MIDLTTPFLLEDADRELHRLRVALPHIFVELRRRLKSPSPEYLFPLLHFDQKYKVARLSADQVGAMDSWFFIGDLHGDFYALHTLLRQAQTLNPQGRILFLGDMVDRGPMPIECIFLLLEWGLRHPGRLAWIAGNHDVAFVRKESGEFVSKVSPAEFLAVLNGQDLFAGFRRQLGEFFVDMADRLPRALLFPDGLLATHGGFPLVDRHPQGQAAADEQAYLDWLNTEDCLKDFTWSRIHRVPKRIPDRHSSGPEYGFLDFEAFCRLQPQWFRVTHMVTGHQHPAQGFETYPSYKVNRALTLLGMGRDEFTGKYTDHLHLGRGVAGTVPEVIPVPVQRDALAMLLHGKLPDPPAPPGVAPAPAVVAAPAPAAPAPAPAAPAPAPAEPTPAPAPAFPFLPPVPPKE